MIGRFFNIVGSRQLPDYGMVLPRFIRSAHANAPIEVYGSGTQTRSFTWIRDAIGAIVALMDCPTANGQVVNIGNPSSCTILELAHLVKALLGSDSEIVFIPHEARYGPSFQDTHFRRPSSARLWELIGEFEYTPVRSAIALLVDTAARAGLPA